MSSPLVPLVLAGVLGAVGVYLLLDRSLTRVLLGILVLGNAVNVVVVTSGGPTGAAPLVGKSAGTRSIEGSTPIGGLDQMVPATSDPLVQALVLTAVVITLGVAAFVLSLIHRTWSLEREDDLAEDAEDRAVRRRLELDEQDDEDELDTTGCEEVSDTDDERDAAAPVTAGRPAGGSP